MFKAKLLTEANKFANKIITSYIARTTNQKR